MARIRIANWGDLQRLAPEIVSRLNDDPALALAGAANPIIALKELGYQVDDETAVELEERLRFGPKLSAQLRRLRKRLTELAGHPVDPRSPEQLRRVVVDELRIQPTHKGPSSRLAKEAFAPLPHQREDPSDTSDPLAILDDAHPIMKPLLEYRRLDASVPRFASERQFTEIRSGKRSFGIERLRGRLQAGAGEVPADDADRSPGAGGVDDA